MSDAVMPEVEYEVWQDGDWVAGSNDRADAEHYLTLYGQDGPVEAKTSFTYRVDGFTDTHALAASTPVGGWEDISTAPKDGTSILVANANGEIFVVCWGADTANGPGWIDGATDFVGDLLIYTAPTHWMPLPPPPSVSTGSRPQEAVPGEGQSRAVVAALTDVATLADRLINGGGLVNRGVGCGLVVVEKKDRSDPHYQLCAALETLAAVRKATPQPADGCSSNEGVA